jgi:hypothetical protein
MISRDRCSFTVKTSSAQAHEIFENYIKQALNSFKAEVNFTFKEKQYKFSILSA